MTQTFLLAPDTQLVALLGQAKTWTEVEMAIAAHPTHKTAAWQMLSVLEKSRLKELKQRAAETQLHQYIPAPDEPLKVGDNAILLV